LGNALPKIQPKIKVHQKDLENPYPSASGGDIAFTLISSPAKGRQAVMQVMTCRDYINDVMMKSRRPKYLFNYYNGEIPVDWDRLRLGIFTHVGKNVEEEHEKLLFAKKIINIYEKLGHFSRKSTITRSEYDEKTNAWLLTGPKEWMKSTHLVSMVTLILRVVHKIDIFKLPKKSEINNISDINAFFEKIKNDNILGIDHNYLKSYKIFEILMVRYSQIFDIPRRSLFPKQPHCLWHSKGGINSLCNTQTYITELDENVRKECKIWQTGEYEK
jgi:hypothetical protein